MEVGHDRTVVVGSQGDRCKGCDVAHEDVSRPPLVSEHQVVVVVEVDVELFNQGDLHVNNGRVINDHMGEVERELI